MQLLEDLYCTSFLRSVLIMSIYRVSHAGCSHVLTRTRESTSDQLVGRDCELSSVGRSPIPRLFLLDGDLRTLGPLRRH